MQFETGKSKSVIWLPNNAIRTVPIEISQVVVSGSYYTYDIIQNFKLVITVFFFVKTKVRLIKVPVTTRSRGLS